MKRQFFGDIVEFIQTYNNIEESKNDDFKRTYKELITRLKTVEGLGYYQSGDDNFDSKILTILSEQNPNLSSKEKSEIINYYKLKTQNSDTRRSFFIRAFISILIISVSLFYITLGKNPNQDVVKALFGLMGVIVGYWFK